MPGFYDAILQVDQQRATSPTQTSQQPITADEDMTTFLARRAIPFYSAYRNFMETRDYTAAKERATSGNARSADQDIISTYEAQQRRDESRGVGGQILSAVANIPALVGETAVGGAVLGRLPAAFSAGTSLAARAGRVAATTALAPSFYLQQAAQRAQENGGQWYEPQNLGVAGAMGMAQTAILGALPNIARGVPGNGAAALAARLGIRTGAGMLEQQGVDLIGGIADEVLPQAYQTRTRYGLLGDAMRGEWGHFGQHLAVQAVTFAAFSALHSKGAEEKPAEKAPPGPGEPGFDPTTIPPAERLRLPEPTSKPAAESYFAQEPLVQGDPVGQLKSALDALHKQGISRDAATRRLAMVENMIVSELRPKGRVTAQEAIDIVDKMRLAGPPELKDFARGVAERQAVIDYYEPKQGRERIPGAPIPADLLAKSAPREEPPADIRPRVTNPIESQIRPGGLEVRAGAVPPLTSEPPRYGPELVSGQSRAPFTRRVTESVPIHPLPGEREAARGARAGATQLPIPPEMLTRVTPPVVHEPSNTPRPGFRPEHGVHVDPLDEIGRAMLAKRVPIGSRSEPPAAPPSPPEAPKVPGVTPPPPKPPAGKLTPKLRAEWEAKMAAEGLPAATLSERQKKVNAAREAAGLEPKAPTRMTRHGPVTGEQPIAEHVASAIEAAKLPPNERAALEGHLAGNSFRALEDTLGVSYQTVSNRANAAWEKIIKADPKLGEKFPTLTDYVDDSKNSKAEALIADLAPGQRRKGYEKSTERTAEPGDEPAGRSASEGAISGERMTEAKDLLDQLAIHEETVRKDLADVDTEIRAKSKEAGLSEDVASRTQDVATPEEIAAYKNAKKLLGPRGPFGETRLSTATGTAEPRVAEPITPERVKAVSDISLHHEALVGKIRGMILSSNVPTPKKMEYLNNQLRILTEMTPTAAALHLANMKTTEFHADLTSLTNAAAKISEDARAIQAAGQVVDGIFNRGNGTMMLDGGGEGHSGARVAGHETGHAIDGRNETISNSPDVQQAYLKEGLKGTIGEYARNSTQEFLAETLGLVWSGEMTPADLRTKMPLMYEAMVSRDLIRRAEGASHFEKPADIFDKSINDGPIHGDVGVRLSVPEEKTTPEKAMEKARALEKLSGVITGGWQKLGANMWEGAKSTLDNWNQFSGKGFVKTTAIDRLSGEAMGRFAGTQGAVNVAIPDFVDLIAGKNASPEMMHRQYAMLLEISARHAKSQFEKFGHTDKAAEVTTFIAGQENSNASSPFKSEADFRAFRESAEGKRVEAAYKEHFVPELEADYRSYKGMMEEEAIKGVAQIPDMPINFMRVDPESLSSSPFYMGGPGNLKNPKAGKLTFDQTATRAHSYETDMIKGLTNSLGKTKALANKKAMYDRMVATGIAERGPKGGSGQLKNGDKVWELPDVFSNRDSLYVSERIKPELQQLLNLDSKFTIPIASEFAKIATRSMGVGFIETVSHLKNIATSLMGAGVNPLDLVPHVIRVVRGDPEINKKILELAKINAYRGGGLESGQLWGGKSDPTSWLSKLISIMDTSARLTLQSGYERNVRMGRTVASETGLRDFVNQGLGDYNKLSQHKVIKWLRDTGIGPFATAGTKFYTSATRLLVGDPNFTATSYTQAALARAEIFAKLAVVVGAVAVANKALWKNIWGDDDTPFGAIKTGKTADGKTTYLDLTAFTGLTRGMRQVGLLALTEGLRLGSSPQRIADRAAESFYTSLLHPMEGPVVNFAHTMITGRDTFGRDVVPPESAGGSRALESLRAAAIQANPLTAATLGHDKRAEDMTYGARALELLGPFNPFKQRGDQVLGELHGRLRELESLRRAFYTIPDNTSRPFAREAEYRVLKKFDESVGKLNDALSGTAQTREGRRQIERPATARINELRQQITELANRAIQTQRQYQGR